MIESLKHKKLDARSIKTICLSMSILGIVVIWLAESSISLPVTPISEITNSDSGRYVMICGTVKDKYISNKGTLFFSLCDDSEIDIVLFNDNRTDLDFLELDNNDYTCIEGKIDVYQGELELIAEKLVTSSHE